MTDHPDPLGMKHLLQQTVMGASNLRGSASPLKVVLLSWIVSTINGSLLRGYKGPAPLPNSRTTLKAHPAGRWASIRLHHSLASTLGPIPPTGHVNPNRCLAHQTPSPVFSPGILTCGISQGPFVVQVRCIQAVSYTMTTKYLTEFLDTGHSASPALRHTGRWQCFHSVPVSA